MQAAAHARVVADVSLLTPARVSQRVSHGQRPCNVHAKGLEDPRTLHWYTGHTGTNKTA